MTGSESQQFRQWVGLVSRGGLLRVWLAARRREDVPKGSAGVCPAGAEQGVAGSGRILPVTAGRWGRWLRGFPLRF
jgi:hypothetical protein